MPHADTIPDADLYLPHADTPADADADLHLPAVADADAHPIEPDAPGPDEPGADADLG